MIIIFDCEQVQFYVVEMFDECRITSFFRDMIHIYVGESDFDVQF